MAPPAVNVVPAPPEQIDVEGVTVTVGGGCTVTVTDCEAEQPPVVPVTVYVVVEPGSAVGLGQLVQLNPVTGNHE